MQLKAYAKINWDLHVLGRRSDGFHELDSIFVNVDLCDTLTFEAADEFRLTCSDPRLACDDSNLVAKAAHALAHASGHPCRGHIHLDKTIPMGGGLGGGSSDAATALAGLNRLWNLNWERERLHEIGAKLGSDVAYFLYGGWCRCRGRGEIVEPLSTKANLSIVPLLLIFPNLHVSTPAVYKRLDYPAWDGKSGQRALTDINISIECLQQTLMNQNGASKFVIRNDLTEAAHKIEPGLVRIQQVLEDCCPGRWLMSGSGATHFVVIRDASEGASLSELLQARIGPNLRVLTTMTLTPVI